MKLLTDIDFSTKTNNWYAPLSEFWERHRSIHAAYYVDQTSSAGDWTGFIIQRTGKTAVVAIPFQQENNYPGDGFTLQTGRYPFYRGRADEKDLIDNVRSCYLQFFNPYGD